MSIFIIMFFDEFRDFFYPFSFCHVQKIFSCGQISLRKIFFSGDDDKPRFERIEQCTRSRRNDEEMHIIRRLFKHFQKRVLGFDCEELNSEYENFLSAARPLFNLPRFKQTALIDRKHIEKFF